MRPRTLGILLLLVAALAAFAWFVDRDLPGSEEREENAKKVLLFDAEEVAGIVIERSGVTLRFEAGETSTAPKRWRLTQPLVAAADGERLRSLVADLGSLESQREIEDPDRAGLGLETPRARVTLELEGSATRTLEVGSPVPSSDSMLVAVAGSGSAHVVMQRLFDDLSRGVDEWRDRGLFQGERAQIERIRLAPAVGPETILARQGEWFALESPLADAADRDQVDALLDDLVGLQAQSFVDSAGQPATEYGLGASADKIEVTFSEGFSPLEIALGAVIESTGRRYARVGEEMVEIEANLTDWFTPPVESWRSKSWTGFESWQIDDATLSDAEGTVELRRQGADWLRNGERIGFTEVSELLAAVVNVGAESLVDAMQPGSPVLTLELESSEGEQETLTLYPEAEGNLPARASGRDVTLLIPPETLVDLRDKLTKVRVAKPLPDAEVDETDTAAEGETAEDPI